MQMTPEFKQTAIAAGPRLPRSVIHRLRCPVCRSKLLLRSDRCVCEGARCRREFPLKNGIPILIDSRLSVFEECSQPESNPPPSGPAATAKRLAAALLPSLGRNIGSKQAYAKFAEILLAISTKPKVLVVGGATIGAGLETILKKNSIEFIESDVYLSPRTALVCDAHQIPFEGDTFDGVIVQAVLEHVADPAACVEEIHRVLKPQGLVYSDTPFMQQVHAAAFDFTRFTDLGHRRLFRYFEEIERGVACGPASALAWSFQHFLIAFSSGPRSRKLLTAFSRLSVFWLKYFDHWLVRRKVAHDGASSLYFFGRKQSSAIDDRRLLELYRGAPAS